MQKLITLFIVFMVAAGIVACDVTGEQNFEFEPANSLAIVGPQEVTVPDTASYYVQAFTINKDYTWTVNGTQPDSVYRDGEFINVIFDSAGTYTIEVEDGEYTGTLEVTAVESSS